MLGKHVYVSQEIPTWGRRKAGQGMEASLWVHRGYDYKSLWVQKSHHRPQSGAITAHTGLALLLYRQENRRNQAPACWGCNPHILDEKIDRKTALAAAFRMDFVGDKGSKQTKRNLQGGWGYSLGVGCVVGWGLDEQEVSLWTSQRNNWEVLRISLYITASRASLRELSSQANKKGRYDQRGDKS